MTEEDNPFNLKCIFCGRPLVPGPILRGNNTNVGLSATLSIGQSSEYNLTVKKSLGCPNGQKYYLNEVGNFQFKDLLIEESVLSQLAMELKSGKNFTNILKRLDSKVYVVNYGFFGRILIDRTRIRSSPSPSNRVLDKIKIFICTKGDVPENNTFIFSGVPEKVPYSLNRWVYNVVYYEKF